MIHQKSRDKFGYLEFLDQRGLSNKCKRVSDLHERLAEIDAKIVFILDELKLVLARNSTTIVSDNHFDHLEAVVENTYKMWKEVEYPFIEDIFIRTSTFKNIIGYNLPYFQIPYTNAKNIAQKIINGIGEKNRPEQLLLHPRLSLKHLQERLIVARFKSTAGKIIAEFGHGGIGDVRELNQAENIATAELDSELEIDLVKGCHKYITDDRIKRMMLGARAFLTQAEGILIPEESQHKDVIYEFRNIPNDGKLYMMFNDFEVE